MGPGSALHCSSLLPNVQPGLRSVDAAAQKNWLTRLWRLRHQRSVMSSLEAREASCLVSLRVGSLCLSWILVPTCQAWKWSNFLNHKQQEQQSNPESSRPPGPGPGGLWLFRKRSLGVEVVWGAWADSGLCLPARLGRRCFWGTQHTISSGPSLRGTSLPGDPSGLAVSAVSSASQEELGEK